MVRPLVFCRGALGVALFKFWSFYRIFDRDPIARTRINLVGVIIGGIEGGNSGISFIWWLEYNISSLIVSSWLGLCYRSVEKFTKFKAYEVIFSL